MPELISIKEALDLLEAQFIKTKGVSRITKLSESALEKMRLRGDGPPFCRAGARCIVYRVSDVVAWLESRKAKSTSKG